MRNLTNSSAAAFFFVFVKTERLMPATWVMIGVSEPSATGSSATPYSSFFMPSDFRLFSALFW